MKTVTKTVTELLESKESPFPLEVIPNQMGINLCSVEALTWTRREDEQLVSLTIHFLPASVAPKEQSEEIKCVKCGKVLPPMEPGEDSCPTGYLCRKCFGLDS